MDDFLGFTEGSAIRVTKSTFNDNVNFSDDSGESAFEEVEFVNGIIRRLWPDIRIWMSRIVKDLEPVVRKVDLIAGLNLDMIKFIGQFKFRRIDFGDIVSFHFVTKSLLTAIFAGPRTDRHTPSQKWPAAK